MGHRERKATLLRVCILGVHRMLYASSRVDLFRGANVHRSGMFDVSCVSGMSSEIPPVREPVDSRYCNSKRIFCLASDQMLPYLLLSR